MKTKTPRIRAARSAEPNRLRIEAAAPVEIEAAQGQGKRPTFRIVAYTGGQMHPTGFSVPVIVELSGLKTRAKRIPILLDHDSSRIIGMTDGIEIDGSGVRLVGTITADDDDSDARKVVSHARNGFEWQASIGAGIVRQEFLKSGEKATVNGREVSGPILIAREARLDETSFVAMGADPMTTADVAAMHSDHTQPPASTVKGATMFEKWLEAKGFDPTALNDDQRASLKAMYDAEQAKGKAPDPPAESPAKLRLDDIIAEQRREDERVSQITRIVAEAIRERPGMIDELERMAKAAIEAKSAPAEFELAVLRATRAPAGIGGPAIHRGGRAPTPQVFVAALCRAGGLDNIEKHFDGPTLEAADSRFRNGLGLCEMLTISARENGWNGHSVKGDLEGCLRAAFPRDVRAQGWSTVSLPNIFANTANKFLATGFNAVETTWRSIAARRPVNDFKAVTGIALTGGFTYEKVGPGGEIKHATLGETTYANQAETYARMLAITRQQIINDDLGALSEIPRKLGRGAALGLNRDFWTVFLNNSAFFTSGRGNLATGAGTALSLTSLNQAQTLFRNQTDPDSDPVSVMPRILLVPNALEITAFNIINSTQIAGDTTANTVTFASNPFAGRFQIAQSSYLSNANITGFSTTAWYLLADPNDMPVIEAVFLNGRETPVVESADADFNTLGIQWRGFFDYGVALQEYRGGVKMAGA